MACAGVCGGMTTGEGFVQQWVMDLSALWYVVNVAVDVVDGASNVGLWMVGWRTGVVLENVREGSVADADVRNACVVDGV